MTKSEANEKALYLLTEMVKAGRIFVAGANDPKQNARQQAEYLTELHKALRAYFEEVQT